MQSRSDTRYLKRIMTGRSRWVFLGLMVLWVVATLRFWIWWWQPSHIESGWRFALITAPLMWLTFLQMYFMWFAARGVRSVAPDPVPGTLRVAMIVTKTPSEPFEVIQKTLVAMLAQDFPHDTWLADEDAQPDTIAWCDRHGVKISCRKGVAAYHQATWPRRTRCKEGNLAYFYDMVGYDAYDVVSQLDSDHVPQPGYLREILRPFADPRVGYVSAPSICASNADQNWAARTRLHTEGAFHGILQSGYSDGFAPMCIGSHYAVRTAALRAAGGLGPELAEDHSTSLLLNAAGWRGVHALDAIAIGDGPATIADLATQEFQWSRSLLTLLLQHTPRYLGKLSWRLRAQFLFCQLFYPIAAVTFLMMYLMPICAVIFDVRYADITFPDYLNYAVPQVAAMVLIAWVLRKFGTFRPYDAPVLSWEKALFVLMQWPWVLWGCVSAVRDSIFGGFVDFRITPKGQSSLTRLPLKIIGVYLALALGCILPVLMTDHLVEAQGFYILSLISGLLYCVILFVIVLRHLHENGWPLWLQWRDTVMHMFLVSATATLLIIGFSLRAAESVHSLTIGLRSVEIVDLKVNLAGAGSAKRSPFLYEWRFRWTGSDPQSLPAAFN